MKQTTFIVHNALGFHARPAAAFAKECAKHSCEVVVESQGKRGDGRSMVSLLMCTIKQGATVHVTVSGEDEDELIDAINKMAEANFYDE